MSGRGRYRRSAQPRSRVWRFFDYALTTAIFGLAILFIARMDEVATQSRAGQAHVNDGDTLTIDNARLRLRGIDAPEYRQICQLDGRGYDCGREARRALADLAEGRALICEGWERDKYMRLLVECRDGTKNVNAEMVRLGWAVSYGDYRAEEREARSAKRGLWRGEFETPRDWRVEHAPQDVEAPHDTTGSVWSWIRQLIWPAEAS